LVDYDDFDLDPKLVDSNVIYVPFLAVVVEMLQIVNDCNLVDTCYNVQIEMMILLKSAVLWVGVAVVQHYSVDQILRDVHTVLAHSVAEHVKAVVWIVIEQEVVLVEEEILVAVGVAAVVALEASIVDAVVGL
jgi:hypothetical protein